MTDFVEYDIDPDWWIKRVLKDLDEGHYEPHSPHRFSVAKKLGFSRVMTLPSVPDMVLYRAVVDHLYSKAKRREQDHVYFAQNTLSKKVKEIEKASDEEKSTYTFTSGSAFCAWLEYDQYRKHLLLDALCPYIVTTDITNFFDTVLYDRVADALHGIRIDRNLVGLLFFVLERLSIRDAFNESPRIGLPVDDFDCSRTLAHMVLFPHDDRMVRLVGESRYVRWMDDQNFGATSYSEGLNILKSVGASLSRLHLTPNASKSRIMSFSEASRHFHFDINNDLDEIEKLPSAILSEKRAKRLAVGKTWRKYRKYQGTGEWSKILKRFYRLAGVTGARFLRQRALTDILREPTLSDRVCDYWRVTGSPQSYLDFTRRLWEHDEQVYPDVNHAAAECLLKLEPDRSTAKDIRRVAAELLSGKHRFPGWQRCAALAPLLIVRFGDGRSLRLLRRFLRELERAPHPAVGKAVVAVYVSYGKQQLSEAQGEASRLRDNYLAHFLRMIDEMLGYDKVPERFKIRREPVYDSVAGAKRVDMRKLLVLRLLKLNDHPHVAKWVADTAQWILKQDLSDYDKAMITRLLS